MVRATEALAEAEQTIVARLVTAEEAGLLGVRHGAPVLAIERVTADVTGRRIELARSVYRADRYTYRVRLRRHPRDARRIPRAGGTPRR